jgi:hypothetical protein
VLARAEWRKDENKNYSRRTRRFKDIDFIASVISPSTIVMIPSINVLLLYDKCNEMVVWDFSSLQIYQDAGGGRIAVRL